jgi:hypothetical protein
MNEPLSDANHATAKRVGIAASILNCFLYCRLTVLLVFNYLCFRDSFYNGKGLFDWVGGLSTHGLCFTACRRLDVPKVLEISNSTAAESDDANVDSIVGLKVH